jgi:uncharacterized protein YbjQ (UPF0145 family)
MKNVKVYTNSSFNDTIEIVSYLQPVTYHIVLGVNFFADFLSSFSDFFGGKSQSYQSRLASINNEVIEGIKQKVYSIGGNAAIDLKIDNDEISAQGKSMIMVTAIATAVIIREKPNKEVSANQTLSKSNVRAVTFEDFTKYQKKKYIIKTLEISRHIGPINRLLPEIQPDDFDVLPFVFESINNGEGDVNPKDFSRESLATIGSMLNILDFESRSKILYENLRFVLDEINVGFFRITKINFYIELIEEHNCVDYRNLNDILHMDSKLIRDKIVNHYLRGINNKSIFFPDDIDLLRSGLEILESLDVRKEEYFEKFQQTIDNLEELFE